MATEGTHGPRLEKFDGSDPSAYKKWRRRAELMLISLPSTYGVEKLGPRLMEYVTGEAELAVEHVSVEDLAKANGQQLVFQALDERYKPLAKDDMNEALTEYFMKVDIRGGETMKAFTTRLATANRKLSEHSVSLPKEVQGWFLLKKMKVDPQQEAMLLTSTGGSYQIDKLEKAVRSVLPNATGTTKQTKETYVTDDFEEEDTSSGAEDSEILQVLVADMQQNDEYDEEGMLEVFETYKQVRTKLLEAKKTRGFKSMTNNKDKTPWRLTGSISARLDQVRARTRCFKCNQLGHWKRECTSGRGRSVGSSSVGSGGSTYRAGTSSSAKEVHIIEGSDDEEQSFDRMLAMVDEEVEHYGELDIHLTNVEEEGMVEALSQSTGMISTEDCASFEVFQHDASAQEAYMSAALDRHGVPDTACRRSLIGENVLHRLEEELRISGRRCMRKKGRNVFRFGNAETLCSTEIAVFPIQLGSRRIMCQVAVLPGAGAETPFLMSKEMLKSLGAVIDTQNDQIHFKAIDVTLHLGVTSKGHYAVPLFGDGCVDELERTDTHTNTHTLSGRRM